MSSRHAAKIAKRSMHVLMGMRVPAWSPAAARLVAASLAHRLGDIVGATRSLQESLDGFESAELLSHADAARWQLGQLLGGARGEASILLAKRRTLARGIKDAGRWVEIYAPGFVLGQFGDS